MHFCIAKVNGMQWIYLFIIIIFFFFLEGGGGIFNFEAAVNRSEVINKRKQSIKNI